MISQIANTGERVQVGSLIVLRVQRNGLNPGDGQWEFEVPGADRRENIEGMFGISNIDKVQRLVEGREIQLGGLCIGKITGYPSRLLKGSAGRGSRNRHFTANVICGVEESEVPADKLPNF